MQNAHKMVNSNVMLKHYIKPHLSEPSFQTLKDSTKISTNKINNMMKDLVSFVNELVNDQIQLRSCIPLTIELRKFYLQLMGKDVDDEMYAIDRNDEKDNDRYEEERFERFLQPKINKSKRNAVSLNSFKSIFKILFYLFKIIFLEFEFALLYLPNGAQQKMSKNYFYSIKMSQNAHIKQCKTFNV